MFIIYGIHNKQIAAIVEEAFETEEGTIVTGSMTYGTGYALAETQQEISEEVIEKPMKYILDEFKNIVSYPDYREPINPTEIMEKIAVMLKTPDELYEELDKNADIEKVRAAKINQLKEACTQAIYKGFVSESLGKSFGFNDKDQANFGQKYLLVVSGDNQGANIKWKSLSGVVDMTEAQFRVLIQESADHKMSNQVRYWQLEAQVLSATTNAGIDLINW